MRFFSLRKRDRSWHRRMSAFGAFQWLRFSSSTSRLVNVSTIGRGILLSLRCQPRKTQIGGRVRLSFFFSPCTSPLRRCPTAPTIPMWKPRCLSIVLSALFVQPQSLKPFAWVQGMGTQSKQSKWNPIYPLFAVIASNSGKKHIYLLEQVSVNRNTRKRQVCWVKGFFELSLFLP